MSVCLRPEVDDCHGGCSEWGESRIEVVSVVWRHQERLHPSGLDGLQKPLFLLGWGIDGEHNHTVRACRRRLDKTALEYAARSEKVSNALEWHPLIKPVLKASVVQPDRAQILV